MKHVKTINTRNLKESMKKGGCGECQTSASLHVRHPAQLETRAVRISNQAYMYIA